MLLVIIVMMFCAGSWLHYFKSYVVSCWLCRIWWL